jgi:N-acetylglucosaminyl-diphospho-decaprenol L-rhamnosyltransferase
MKVSAIIVTHNQHDLLRTCVRSVLTALKGMDGETIVVDNASTDATPGIITEEFPGVRYIRNPVNLYYTRAVNQGMRAASGEYVYLLNDDTELEPGNIKTLAAFMDANPRCGACGPAMRSPEHEPQVAAQKFPTPTREVLRILGIAHALRNRKWAERFQKQYPSPMSTQRVDWVCGGAIFLRRELMARLGYHDEKYLFYLDDPDIGMRLRDAGYEVWHCAETYVLHHHGRSTVKTPRKLRFEIIAVRSRRHYYRKLHGLAACAAVELAHGVGSGLRAVKCTILGRTPDARRHWSSLKVLFEAFRMPAEEREAYAGYSRCVYNGLNGDPGASVVAAGKKAEPVENQT